MQGKNAIVTFLLISGERPDDALTGLKKKEE
jgi:hypothetical protein